MSLAPPSFVDGPPFSGMVLPSHRRRLAASYVQEWWIRPLVIKQMIPGRPSPGRVTVEERSSTIYVMAQEG